MGAIGVVEVGHALASEFEMLLLVMANRDVRCSYIQITSASVDSVRNQSRDQPVNENISCLEDRI